MARSAVARRPSGVARPRTAEPLLRGETVADAPRGLSPAQRQRWLHSLGTARSFFPERKLFDVYDKATWSPGCHLDIALRGAKELDSAKLRARPKVLPDPGPGTSYCGVVLEIFYTTPCGRIANIDFRSKIPDMMWSPYCKFDRSKGSILFFPGRRVGMPTQSCPKSVKAAASAYKRWNDGIRQKGRGIPNGCTPVELDDVRMRPADPCIAIAYRSDKYSDNGKTEDYIHIFNKDVFLLQSEHGQQESYFISGGTLKLTDDGLEN